jgi:hypothetical protein
MSKGTEQLFNQTRPNMLVAVMPSVEVNLPDVRHEGTLAGLCSGGQTR